MTVSVTLGYDASLTMLRHQAFQFRIEPTDQQLSIIKQTAGTVRFIWNSALALQKLRLSQKLKLLNFSELCKELTEARRDPELQFLSEIHSKPQQQILKDLGRAFKDFFSGGKGFPRFKKKGRSGDSFRFPAYQGNIEIVGRRVKLPALGWVRFRKSRSVKGDIKNVTVSRRGGHWFISVQTEREVSEPIHPSTGEVGLDVGVKRFVTLSTGEFVEPLDSFRRLEQKLAKAQRFLSRKQKFSQNWKKQKAAITRLHIRIADARNDFLHKVSTSISKSHAVVYIEDLRVRNMSASAKGTAESPGKNIKAKSGLNKSILDQGWYEFRRQLEYKQHWRGGRVVAVAPQYTSQRCSACGHVSAESRQSQSEFVCTVCGYEDNADVNAAKNIARAGQALSACGSSPAGGRNQEPGETREGLPQAAVAA